MVGSIDSNNGDNGDGTSGGQLLFNLGKRTCEDFGTCSNGFAKVNDGIISLLETGKSYLVGNKCNGLKSTVKDIEKLLLVPLVQGLILSAARSDVLEGSTTSQAFAEGFVFANSILPIVDRANSRSASIISQNMVHPFTTRTVPVLEGKEVVFNAISIALTQMGVDCENVGVYENYDFCQDSTLGSSHNFALVILFIIILSLCPLVIYLCRRSP